ncbi:MAG: hypothetical protein EHM72_18670 [Calditrichaeota bacterium]|nr:MAG: hypothetical protein EHM72_18670 [Calditrichota bacterium]
MMKRLLNILLCLFYLVSSVGYVGVEHYCSLMHHPAEASAEACCCDASVNAMACSSDAAAQESDSCCGENDHPLNAAPKTPPQAVTISAKNCCETVNSYHQIDESTTKPVADQQAQTASLPFQMLVFSTDSPNYGASYAHSPHPSFHFNLPLLI